MRERPNRTVSKTVVSFGHRGFKSHSLRQCVGQGAPAPWPHYRLEGMGQPDQNVELPSDVLAELARVVLADETMHSILDRIAQLAKRVIPGADEVSVTLVTSKGAATAAYTGDLAMQADERQYGLDGGPCLDAGRGGVVLIIRDMRTEDRWPDYAPEAAKSGVLSSLSVPLPIQEDVVGALNIYSRKPDAFGDEATALGVTFAAYAAIAVANANTFVSTAELADQMQAAMKSRVDIEQAKGILMAREGITPDEAFEILVRASQRENRKLRDIARDIVERTQQRV
jgi:GAF domain-containing protein